MDIKFDFDAGDFERRIKELARDGLKDLGARVQAACDAVEETHRGQQVAAVEKALRAELAARDAELPDHNVEAYCKAIAEGRHIVVEVDDSALR